MSDRERLDKLVADVEDEKNGYAGFSRTYENCVIARELLARLHDDGQIEDEEFVASAERIGAAKRRLVETSRAWVAGAIGQSRSNLTRENIVFSVYDVAFRHVLA
jgi:hypothetical protein